MICQRLKKLLSTPLSVALLAPLCSCLLALSFGSSRASAVVAPYPVNVGFSSVSVNTEPYLAPAITAYNNSTGAQFYFKSSSVSSQAVAFSINRFNFLGGFDYRSGSDFDLTFSITIQSEDFSSFATPYCSVRSAYPQYYVIDTCEVSPLGSGFLSTYPSKDGSGVPYYFSTDGYISVFYHLHGRILSDADVTKIELQGAFLNFDFGANSTVTISYKNFIVMPPAYSAEVNAVEENTKAVEEQTKQQQEQYEQDKQEEADRENQGKDDADEAQNVFRLDLFNPFAPIFEMFNPGGCVSIPTIASWLHVDNPQVCPWFPDSVRSVLTPVISIASIMLLFGFVVKWLRSGDGFVI